MQCLYKIYYLYILIVVPDTSRPISITKLRIGTASAGDTHSLACRINPLAATILPRYGVVGVTEKEISTSGHPKLGVTCPYIFVI